MNEKKPIQYKPSMNSILHENEEKIVDIFQEKFNEKLQYIVTLSQNDFYGLVIRKIKKAFEIKSKEAKLKPYDDKQYSTFIKAKEKEIITKYKEINSVVSNALNKKTYDKLTNNFKAHCEMADEPIHHCQGKLLIIKEKTHVRYVLCEKCKELYLPYSILLFCSFCSCNYVSSLDDEKSNENLVPATWEQIHCNDLSYEKMRCIKCKDIFYLNISENRLHCKNCLFAIDPLKVIWQCTTCNGEFKSPAKPYNALEHHILKSMMKEVLNLQEKAKPLVVPCCKFKIHEENFFHKKTCKGILYIGDFKSNSIVICSECKMINYFDNFVWTCPKCLKRFRKSNKTGDDKKKSIDVFSPKKEIPVNQSKQNEAKSSFEIKPELSDNFRSSIISVSEVEEESKIQDKKEEVRKQEIKRNLQAKKQEEMKKHEDMKKKEEEERKKIEELRIQEEKMKKKDDEKKLEDEKNKNKNEKQNVDPTKENLSEELLEKLKTFTVEDYKILQTVGEGANGVIYLVEDQKKRRFGMKKLIANSEDELEMLIREYELIHKINHPQILKILGLSYKKLDETTNILYILMELGKSDWHKEITMRAANKNYYNEEELLKMVHELVSALAFLQEMNIAHRDIKPHNILIFENRTIKLADFGEAKIVKMSAKKQLGTLRGTELYMAPILFQSLDSDDLVEHNPYKSDVFSLGYCILLASTLNFNILYDIRKLTNKKEIQELVESVLSKKFSDKFITLVCRMVEFNEKFRFDFIQLKNFLENTTLK